MSTISRLVEKITFRNMIRAVQIVIDWFRGLDFVTTIEPEEMGYDPKLVVRSSPSGNKYLANLLKDIHVTDQDTIIDIGCGKGSAMLIMTKFPFSKVDGIELSSRVAEIAGKNFSRLKQERCHIFNCDAVTFQDFSSYSMIYFYNPFPAVIMRPVIRHIEQSIQNGGREVLVIYNNPACHDVIVEHGVFFKKREYPDEWGNRIYVYSNLKEENSRLN